MTCSYSRIQLYSTLSSDGAFLYEMYKVYSHTIGQSKLHMAEVVGAGLCCCCGGGSGGGVLNRVPLLLPWDGIMVPPVASGWVLALVESIP